jgi:hypothetical protein
VLEVSPSPAGCDIFEAKKKPVPSVVFNQSAYALLAAHLLTAICCICADSQSGVSDGFKY